MAQNHQLPSRAGCALDICILAALHVLHSCSVQEGEDYDMIPGSDFTVARTANRLVVAGLQLTVQMSDGISTASFSIIEHVCHAKDS